MLSTSQVEMEEFTKLVFSAAWSEKLQWLSNAMEGFWWFLYNTP